MYPDFRMEPLRTVLLYTVLWAAVVTRLHPAQELSRWGEGANIVTQLPSPVYDWSADGRHLAYADRGDIFLIEVPTFDVRRALLGRWQHRAGADVSPRNRRTAASGGEAVAFSRPGWTDSEIPIRQILWSPDGKRLAFVAPRREDGWDTIWLAEIAGSGTRDLLPPAVSAQFGSPGVRAVGIEAWLSERDLVFSQHVGTGSVALYRVNVETGDFAAYCTASVDGGSSWAPGKQRAALDGHLGALILVNASQTTRLGASAGCNPALRGCEVVDGKLQGHWYAFESWSPDGSRAILTRRACRPAHPANAGPGNLFLWDAGREEALQEAQRDAALAAWSPDGSRIAFLRFQASPNAGPPRLGATLAVLDVKKGAVSDLLPIGTLPAAAEHWREFRPVWAPDGQQLLTRDEEGNLYVLRADGTERRLVVRGARVMGAWSPGGRWLIVKATDRQDISLDIAPPSIVQIP